MPDDLDAVAAAPDHHKVLFEDDRVRVLETLIRPGEETAVHTHVWSGVLYVIGWSACIRTDEHGMVMMDSVRDGVSHAPGTAIPAAPIPLHALRNVGIGNIHVILTEFKQ